MARAVSGWSEPQGSGRPKAGSPDHGSGRPEAGSPDHGSGRPKAGKREKSRHGRAHLFPAILLITAGSLTAAAQTRLDPGAGLRDEVLPEPEFAPEAPELGLPPPPEPRFTAPEEGGLLLREVRIQGNTVLAPDELAAVARPFVGRRVGIEELVLLRDAITRLYIDRGYVNSGAVLPDQEIADGVVVFQIVEGRLDTITVNGARGLRPEFVASRLRRGAGPPLAVGDLQEQLQLLLLDPNVDRLDARLVPGDRPGVGRLEVELVERPRFVVESRVANDISPSIGGVAFEISATWRSLAGFGDPFRFLAGYGQGYRKLAGAYSVPLTASDLRLHLAAETIDADIVDDDLEPLGIESSSARASGGLTFPLLQSVRDTVQVGALFEWERSKSFLLNEEFAFDPGSDDGRTELTILRLGHDWLRRERSFALAARSSLSIGLDLPGVTDLDGEPDGEFVAWLGLAEAALRPFDERSTLVLRAGLQLSDDALPTLEQIAIGGADTVRGYPENTIVTDNGWFASIEYRYPVLDLAIPSISTRPEDGRLFVAPFFDLGGGWNERAPDPDPQTLAGLGAGLLWSPSENLSFGLYWGAALIDTDNGGDDDPQDWGIHFAVATRFP